MPKLSERLKEALQLRQMKPSMLSYKTGISEASISHYLAGHYEPKTKKIKAISKALRVSDAWLSGLDVPMQEVSAISEKPSELTEGEERLIKLIQQMPPEMQALYEDTLRATLKAQGLIE